MKLVISFIIITLCQPTFSQVHGGPTAIFLSEPFQATRVNSYSTVFGIHLHEPGKFDLQISATSLNQSKVGYVQALYKGLSLLVENIDFGAILGIRSGLGLLEIDGLGFTTQHAALGAFVRSNSNPVTIELSYLTLIPQTASKADIDSFEIRYNRKAIEKYSIDAETSGMLSFAAGLDYVSAVEGRYEYIDFEAIDRTGSTFFWYGKLKVRLNPNLSLAVGIHQANQEIDEQVYARVFGSVADLELFQGGSLALLATL
ncbi:hypothetical protein [Pseudobacteriovorax antillogorgiicola]|uniref:Uncharacterized protein n=1 Tax=Pseudobacteriovorax antillogorgiicola TaxID=1513793 RepID=A0A1Y6BWA7_9BACT|nr:hypothetical protein [Pseudobacteriovorax antillogorgiicola]TCS50184.1 hypothetical protein EDD56_1132 [Pseudobacteriovorax antillogorgiicola]SMF32103.1 hypothetical protein SAMN06296036_1101 [Pseudobacteriovorax antillogorgiicola]